MGQPQQQDVNEVIIDGQIENDMTVSFPLSAHGEDRAVGKVICCDVTIGRCVIESEHSPGTFTRHYRQEGGQTIISY